MSTGVSEVQASSLRPVSSRASSRTGNHSLQLPGCEKVTSNVGGGSGGGGGSGSSGGVSSSKIPQLYLRTLFEDNIDELQEYCSLVHLHKIRCKSFSTNDIMRSCASEVENESQSNSGNSNNQASSSNNTRKYLSECDLISYSDHQSYMKDISNDYITYSCSTLAICGDTVHNSSQLPSPQTQSIRHLANSFILSDLDLIKSLSKKIRLDCIKERQRELLRALEPGTITPNEIDRINGVHCRPILTPFYGASNNGNVNELLTDNGDILIQIVDCGQSTTHHKPIQALHKKDRELFVLNWLQSVESNPNEQQLLPEQ